MTESHVQVAKGKIWEDGLFDLLMLMHEENGMAPVNKDKTREVLQRGLMQHRAVIGAIGTPEKVEGAVGLYISQWWYSDEHQLEDLFNFVRPDNRRSDHAKRLLSFATQVSDQLKIPLLMGVLSTERTAAKVRLYERRLPHEMAGALFFHRPEGCEVSHV